MELKILALSVLQLAVATPVLRDLMVADDTQTVGTYIRPARSTGPEDYHRSYENEGDGEIGYSRKKTGGGKKGYQHFDSYHKKAGDNYEFEKQDSYGHDDEGQAGAHSHRNERKADAYREPEEREEDEEPQKNHKKNNKNHEELREAGPSDHNIEVTGYDPADYTLPEKYTYGTGEEYDFKK